MKKKKTGVLAALLSGLLVLGFSSTAAVDEFESIEQESCQTAIDNDCAGRSTASDMFGWPPKLVTDQPWAPFQRSGFNGAQEGQFSKERPSKP